MPGVDAAGTGGYWGAMTETSGKPLLRVLAGEALQPPPVWLMRQAGRYLPEYRTVREHAGDFLSLCYDPGLVRDVTLQPVSRFGLDGAIIFSDILLLPHALGCALEIVEGTGPMLDPVVSLADVRALRGSGDALEHLGPVYEGIACTARSLPASVALIGFAGSPWTVATYMIMGQGRDGQVPAQAFARDNPGVVDALMDVLIEGTIGHLVNQVQAGAEVLMLFDSWAGILSGADYERYVLTPNRAIVAALRTAVPAIPLIAFPRGSGQRYTLFVEQVGPDCISIDPAVDPVWAAKTLQPHCCVQGNLDPLDLVAGGTALKTGIEMVLDALGGGAHVFNLGHGILPPTDPDHIRLLVECIRQR